MMSTILDAWVEGSLPGDKPFTEIPNSPEYDWERSS